jgi:hypothetical protein
MGVYTKGLGSLIPRTQRRNIEEREEERREGVVDSAALLFRRRVYQVPVINISSRGTMVEAPFMPMIGETVAVEFENCDPIQGFVRWVRDGRIGINFGHELVVG